MRTKIDKTIASSETTIVKRPNGNGSKATMPGMILVFKIIQTMKMMLLKKRKAEVPEYVVRSSAAFVMNDLDLRDFATNERMNFLRLSNLAMKTV